MSSDSGQTGDSAPCEWVRRHAGLIPAGGLVLDVACGGGRHTRYLVKRGYRVMAVDIDVSRLGDIAHHPDVTVVKADLETGAWPFESDLFDGIVVVNYLYRAHFPFLVSSLRSGGVLIFDTFAVGNEAYGRPRNPDFLLQHDELRLAFADTLTEIAFEQGKIELPRPAIRQQYCGRKIESRRRRPVDKEHPDLT